MYNVNMTAITEKEIELKIEQVQASFNNISSKLRELEATEMNLQRKKSEMNVELFRLQGEKRVLTELLEENKDTNKDEGTVV